VTNLFFDFWDSDSNQIRSNLFQNRLKIRWDSNPKFRDSSHHYFKVCDVTSQVVLGRVKDSSSHDSILFAFFAGKREDSSLWQ
jgi:hypothetical protein